VRTISIGDINRYKFKTGDLFFGYRKGQLSNIFLPGQVTHVGILDKRKMKILEYNSKKGFNIVSIGDFCKRYTFVSVKRCTDFDYEYARNVIYRFLKMGYKHRDYDVTFAFDNNAYYCSEAVYVADVEERIKCYIEDLFELNWSYISPQRLYESENLKTIYYFNA
jgi:hypothetical protein